MKQLTHLHPKYDQLQLKYGDKSLNSIYGAGEIDDPDIMFVFMNPTAKNIASLPNWKGLRAPWLGTKQVWSIFHSLKLLDSDIYSKILKFKPKDWSIEFCNEVYLNIQNNNIFINEFAKCNQIDSRPLPNRVLKEYLDLIYEEISIIKPKKIVTFGNQVSSILLKKNISVSNYQNTDKETLEVYNKAFNVYPTYYPVGQGQRNLSKALYRIKYVMQQQA